MPADDPKAIERFRRAAESYQWACSVHPELSGYKQAAWEYIREHSCPAYQGKNGAKLSVPSLPTWIRYIQAYHGDGESPKNVF